jgi:hypothetical protein
MKSLQTSRLLRVVGFAVGGVVVAGAAVLVTASAAGLSVGFHSSSPQPSQAETVTVASKSKASAVCSDFITHLSSDLGKSQSQLNSAVQKAIGETLADEVKNGDLTQAQADAIKARLASQPPCTIVGSLKPPAGSQATISAYTQQLMAAAAAALGVSDTTLKADLAKGMNLSQIAAAQKPPVTEAQFRTKLIAQLTPLLDAAVKSKKLTSVQEQMILKQLQTGPIPFWSTSLRKPKTTAPASPAGSTV